MSVVKDLREAAAVTQDELARRAGTSQPTVAAYEAGRKSPTLRTLRRLARAAGQDVVVSFVPRLTREDRRSLFLHKAIGDQLLSSPDEVLARARRNLRRMMDRQPGARAVLNQWSAILQRPVEDIARVLIDPRPFARELRAVTPFAGVLTGAERARVYGQFARNEEE